MLQTGARDSADAMVSSLDTRSLLASVYNELRQLASRYLSGEQEHIFQATALVHEAYMRLMQHNRCWNDRAHFVATAARTMRRILVDQARRTHALKRGAGDHPITLNDEVHGGFPSDNLEALDDALEELRRIDARQALVVELRFFAGMNIDECVALLGVSRRTVCQDWHLARAWLFDQLHRKKLSPDTDGFCGSRVGSPCS